MPFGLIDPIVFFLAVPVVGYVVCLAIALATLFPRLRFGRRTSAEAFQFALKSSLRRYASSRVEPAPPRRWLHFPRSPREAIGGVGHARVGADGHGANPLEMKKVV